MIDTADVPDRIAVAVQHSGGCGLFLPQLVDFRVDGSDLRLHVVERSCLRGPTNRAIRNYDSEQQGDSEDDRQDLAAILGTRHHCHAEQLCNARVKASSLLTSSW